METFQFHRHDEANEVSVHMQVHIKAQHLRPLARKIADVVMQDLDNRLFEQE